MCKCVCPYRFDGLSGSRPAVLIGVATCSIPLSAAQ